jgi:hypothetical protein
VKTSKSRRKCDSRETVPIPSLSLSIGVPLFFRSNVRSIPQLVGMPWSTTTTRTRFCILDSRGGEITRSQITAQNRRTSTALSRGESEETAGRSQFSVELRSWVSSKREYCYRTLMLRLARQYRVDREREGEAYLRFQTSVCRSASSSGQGAGVTGWRCGRRSRRAWKWAVWVGRECGGVVTRKTSVALACERVENEAGEWAGIRFSASRLPFYSRTRGGRGGAVARRGWGFTASASERMGEAEGNACRPAAAMPM